MQTHTHKTHTHPQGIYHLLVCTPILSIIHNRQEVAQPEQLRNGQVNRGRLTPRDSIYLQEGMKDDCVPHHEWILKSMLSGRGQSWGQTVGLQLHGIFTVLTLIVTDVLGVSFLRDKHYGIRSWQWWHPRVNKLKTKELLNPKVNLLLTGSRITHSRTARALE